MRRTNTAAKKPAQTATPSVIAQMMAPFDPMPMARDWHPGLGMTVLKKLISIPAPMIHRASFCRTLRQARAAPQRKSMYATIYNISYGDMA